MARIRERVLVGGVLVYSAYSFLQRLSMMLGSGGRLRRRWWGGLVFMATGAQCAWKITARERAHITVHRCLKTLQTPPCLCFCLC